MSRLTPLLLSVHHIQASVPAPGVDATGASGQTSPIIIVAILIALLLIVGAVKQLGRAFGPIAELVRVMLAALGTAVLLIGAIAVLVATLVVTVGGR